MVLSRSNTKDSTQSSKSRVHPTFNRDVDDERHAHQPQPSRTEDLMESMSNEDFEETKEESGGEEEETRFPRRMELGLPQADSEKTMPARTTTALGQQSENSNDSSLRLQNSSGRRRRRSSVTDSIVLAARKAKVPKNLRKWPRCHACCFGVLIPLNLIVLVSLVVGLVLGKLEMQHEINHNNAVMRLQQADETFRQDLNDIFVQQLPNLCLQLFLQQPKTQDDKAAYLTTIFESIMTNRTHRQQYHLLTTSSAGISDNESSRPKLTNNATNLLELLMGENRTLDQLVQFQSVCGQKAESFRQNWLQDFLDNNDKDNQHYSPTTGQEFTFNFIRCVNRSSPFLFNVRVSPNEEDLEDAHPDTQAQVFATSWKQNQQQLYTQYDDETSSYTELEALTKSYAEATGGNKCAVNMPAAAWFWFTVMSTVGYGNAVPKTWGGRLVTCVVGFVSILLFGGILGTAGGIVTHIMNDFVHRCKKNVSRWRVVSAWGLLWLLWMLLIMNYTISYKTKRLDSEMNEFDYGDAYWFAFISTTTIGFGDYYLEPEGLFVGDMMVLWMQFLIGFVFLSAFLHELTMVLAVILPDLVRDLQENLKYAYDCGEDADLHLSRRASTIRTNTPLVVGAPPMMPTTNDGASRRPSGASLLSTEFDDYPAPSRPAFSHPLLRTNTVGSVANTVGSVASSAGQDRGGELRRAGTIGSIASSIEQQQQQQQNEEHPPPPSVSRPLGLVSPPSSRKPRRRNAFVQERIPRSARVAKPTIIDKDDSSLGAVMEDKSIHFQKEEEKEQKTSTTAKVSPQQRGRSPPQQQQQQQQQPIQPREPWKELWVKQQQPQAPPSPQTTTTTTTTTSSNKPSVLKTKKPDEQRKEAEKPKQILKNAGATPSSSSSSSPPRAQQQQQQQQQERAAAPKTITATFINTGKDHSLIKAELYYKSTRWGPLGHCDSPIRVSTYVGDQWYIVANGVYAKLFTIVDDSSGGKQQEQKFEI